MECVGVPAGNGMRTDDEALCVSPKSRRVWAFRHSAAEPGLGPMVDPVGTSTDLLGTQMEPGGPSAGTGPNFPSKTPAEPRTTGMGQPRNYFEVPKSPPPSGKKGPV